jgi:hypothetical protein
LILMNDPLKFEYFTGNILTTDQATRKLDMYRDR